MQFIIFRIVGKITVNRKCKSLTGTELRHGYLPWKLLRFLKDILDGVFQNSILTDKIIFNVSNNVTSIASTDAFIIKSGHFHSCQLFLILMRDRKQSTFFWYKKIMIIIITTIIITIIAIIIIIIIIISFSKASDFYNKWQWWSLRQSLLLSPFLLVCFQ